MIGLCDVVTYALELEGGNYYVGMTTRLKRRLTQHFHAHRKGAQWTQRHKPIRLLKVWAGNHEKAVTKAGMLKYGRDKVRGYIWCEPDFTPDVSLEPTVSHHELLNILGLEPAAMS